MSVWQRLRNLLFQLLAYLRGEHLIVNIEPKRNITMATKNLIKMGPKTSAKKAVMPAITITDPSDTIALQLVDAGGNPIGNVDPATVTTTLTSDNPAFAITKTDELHYAAKIAAGTTSVANVTATLAYKSGSPGPFAASVAVTMQIPPPAAADLQIVITGA